MSEALLEFETLDREQLDKVFRGEKIEPVEEPESPSEEEDQPESSLEEEVDSEEEKPADTPAVEKGVAVQASDDTPESDQARTSES